MLVKAGFQNAGQSCICAKRLIVENGIADRFVDALQAAAARIRVGDPMDRSTDMGPMARHDLAGRRLSDPLPRCFAYTRRSRR